MRYALVKFRVFLLGENTFAIYTDHASLRMTEIPLLTQRMKLWSSLCRIQLFGPLQADINEHYR